MKIVALSGFGEALPGSASGGRVMAAWVAIVGVVGIIFWSTLHPPRLPRF